MTSQSGMSCRLGGLTPGITRPPTSQKVDEMMRVAGRVHAVVMRPAHLSIMNLPSDPIASEKSLFPYKAATNEEDQEKHTDSSR